jgi:DNA-directed RNA polymerase specialized sigma24 family protein
MIQTKVAAYHDLTELHSQFLAILPNIQQYAKEAYRYLVNFHDREDAIAETIALVWAWYYTLARQGKNTFFDLMILTQTAVRSMKEGQLLSSMKGICRRTKMLGG